MRFSLRRSVGLAAGITLAIAPFTAASLAAQDFEGVITMRTNMRMPDGSPSPEIEYMTRSGKMRLNLRTPMGSMGIIASPAEQKMFMLLDAQRMYTEQPLALGAMQARAGTAPPKAPVITRTGKKETVAGYECEHLLIEGNPRETDVCVARSLGPYVSPTLGTQMPAWQRALAADGAFPLKVTGPDGTVQLEVTKIEKRKLSPSLFDVPDDYTKMQLPAGRRPPGDAK